MKARPSIVSSQTEHCPTADGTSVEPHQAEEDTGLGLYSSFYNMCLYAASILVLILIVRYRNLLPYYSLILLYGLWDFAYVVNKDHFAGRDPIFLLKQISEARTTMSWMLAFQAIFLGGIFTVSEIEGLVSTIIRQSQFDKNIIIITVFCSGVSMLFVPVTLQLGSDSSAVTHRHSPTLATRAMFGMVMWMQKVVIFSSVVILLWIVSYRYPI